MLNDAMSDFSSRRTVTGRCRRRKRAENADIDVLNTVNRLPATEKAIRTSVYSDKAKM